MRLGIFGGTFNPVHFGHLRTAEEVGYKFNLDTVIFIPSGNPPLKMLDMPDAHHRYEMTRLATESNVKFSLSDVELRQTGKSYTVNTLQRLREAYPDDELFFILGADAFLDLHNWWQPDRLIGMADFIVVARPDFSPEGVGKSPYIEQKSHGDDAVPADDANAAGFRLKGGRRAFFVRVTPLGISSTGIRMLVKEGKSIRYLVPEAVEKYIYAHSLYR